jgi:hypothetical protein
MKMKKTRKLRKIIKTIRKRQKGKSKKSKKQRDRSKQKAGTILGIGKDGCIIDSFSSSKYSKENGYVTKIFDKKITVNKNLNDKLAEMDPENKRFNRYFSSDSSNDSSNDFCKECNKNIMIHNPDYISCLNKGLELDENNYIFQKYLIPLDPERMTKKQYRYLRESLQILHNNDISHGDLPNNVMIDPDDMLPRIIDWEEAKIPADTLDKKIDFDAFLYHFKAIR